MSRARFSLIASLCAGLVAATALAVAPAANAASSAGSLAVRGTGSAYTGTSHPSGRDGDISVVSLAVGAGQIASYGIQVYNTGTETAQYKIKLEDTRGPARKVELLAGSLILSKLAAGPDGYVTNPIAPGKSQALTLKVTVPSGTPHLSLETDVHLFSTSGTPIDTAWMVTEVKAPANGTHHVDVFARQGSQPFVGGTDETNGDLSQIATSPAQKDGVAATFNVKVQNNLPQASPVAAFVFTDPACSVVTIKDGSVDVTSEITSGQAYITSQVSAGGFRNFTVTIKRLPNPQCGRYANIAFNVIELGVFNAPAYSVIALVPQAYS